MIVVDTNIISYFFLNGEYTDLAEKAFKKDPHWIAPLLWRSEFRNVLAMYLRKEILTCEDAMHIMEEAERLFNDNEYSVTSANILHLITQSNCSAYDCEFVALAQDLHIHLVTMDNKIVRSFPEITIRLDQFI
ncbi:MAG: type II toxin-antitoxin system VapC family toxin [bacterium]